MRKFIFVSQTRIRSAMITAHILNTSFESICIILLIILVFVGIPKLITGVIPNLIMKVLTPIAWLIVAIKTIFDIYKSRD